MSIIFETLDELQLWNPSNTPGRTFVALVRHAESVLETSSGVSDVESDTVTINCEQLLKFAQALVAQAESGHHLIALQFEGLTILTLALLRQAGLEDALPELPDSLSERSVALVLAN